MVTGNLLKFVIPISVHYIFKFIVHPEPTKQRKDWTNTLTAKSLYPEGPGFPGGPWRKRDMLERKKATVLLGVIYSLYLLVALVVLYSLADLGAHARPDHPAHPKKHTKYSTHNRTLLDLGLKSGLGLRLRFGI